MSRRPSAERHRPELSRQLGATHCGILISVDLGFEPRLDAGPQDPARFLDRVVALITEHVAEPCQASLGDRRDHLEYDHFHIALAGHLGRKVVRPHESAHQIDGMVCVQPTVHLQQL
jgi:hypothetical protein